MRARRWMARGLLAGAGGALALALAAMLGTYLGAPWLEHRFAQWAAVLASLALVAHPTRAEWLGRFEARVERLPGWAGAAALGAALVVFGGFKVAQHLSLNTTALDLSLYQSVVDSLVSGRGFTSSLLQRSFLSEHASFVLVTWAPFYLAWPSPLALLLLQAATTALAAVPLAALGRREGLSRLEAGALAGAFLLNPILWKGFVYDVHPELMLPGLLAATAWAARASRWPLFFLFGLLALSVKEDTALVVAPVCLWLVARRGTARWPPLALAALSLAWMLVALRWVIPTAGDGVPRESRFLLERYGHLGASYGEIVINVLTHPAWWGEWLFARPSLEFIAGLGFTPLLEPLAALAALPHFLLNRATSYGVQRDLFAYYGVPAFSVLLVAAPAAAARAKRRFGTAGALVVGLSLAWPTAMQVTPASWLWPLGSDGPARARLRAVEATGGVCSEPMLVPHLAFAATSPLQLMPACEGARVLLFSPAKYEPPAVRAAVRALGAEALAGEYGATFASPSLVVLERGAKGPLDAEALRLLIE